MKIVEIMVLPEQANQEDLVLTMACAAAYIAKGDVVRHSVQKRSIDARQRSIKIRLQVALFTDKTDFLPERYAPQPKNVQSSPEVVVVGAGPAGLFAALRLIELGLKPIVVERGKNVRDRRRDLAAITRQGKINPESNYCFGEGGAGTYSDGKLYTRSNKRGDVARILDLLIFFGATTDIAIDAHPHIGTNKLPQIISAVSAYIVACGGEILFESKLTQIYTNFDAVSAIEINGSQKLNCKALILATGHSAHDIFRLLQQQKIEIFAKPFALGVRIEHPQQAIDSMQYRQEKGDFLPPASYSLVTQASGRGVYSFCMCPGGIIAPCATAPHELVTNGWSPSKRNNPFANSGLVVEVQLDDLAEYKQHGALASLAFLQQVERTSYEAGGGALVAPAQRATDFLANKSSNTLPKCSYLPGVASVNLHQVLPPFIAQRLKEGLEMFKKQKPDYLHPEAIMLATESRTSSPVRIPRQPHTLMHTQIAGFFPCAEGAGYAGGIVSAAIDGEKCAQAAANFLSD